MSSGKHTIAAWNSLVAMQIKVIVVANQARGSRFFVRCHVLSPTGANGRRGKKYRSELTFFVLCRRMGGWRLLDEDDDEDGKRGTNAGSFVTRDVTVLRRSCALFLFHDTQ